MVGQFYDYAGLTHGFVRHRYGKVEAFDFPGALDTYVRAVNTTGEIVGQYDLEYLGQTYSYVREPFGAISDFNLPGATETVLYNLNDAGDLLGNLRAESGGLDSFVWFGHSDGIGLEMPAKVSGDFQ